MCTVEHAPNVQDYGWPIANFAVQKYNLVSAICRKGYFSAFMHVKVIFIGNFTY